MRARHATFSGFFISQIPEISEAVLPRGQEVLKPKIPFESEGASDNYDLPNLYLHAYIDVLVMKHNKPRPSKLPNYMSRNGEFFQCSEFTKAFAERKRYK